MPCGWEGNCKSGVALAMRHRLQWFIHLKRGVATPFRVAGSFDRAANVSWGRGVAWGHEQS